MTSQRKIEANRRNALKSTGPRTKEGKARSRINAVTHGLTAETLVLQCKGHTESEDRFQLLHNRLIDGLKPDSDYERSLVRELAEVLWRCGRAAYMEELLLTDPAIHTPSRADLLAKVQRWKDRLSKRFHRTLAIYDLAQRFAGVPSL